MSWISVQNQLPENPGLYLVIKRNDNRICIASYDIHPEHAPLMTQWFWYNDARCPISMFSYWAPIPQKPDDLDYSATEGTD